MDGRAADIRRREFERILRERQLRTVFQPVVSLGSGAIVGYEALVRGPRGSLLATADSLLASAYEANSVAEFDWVARASACRDVLAAGLREGQLLFINIEPLALDSDCPRDLWPDIEKVFAQFQVVLEVTERSLDSDPGSLLDGLDRRRPMVAGFALDDVGCDVTTLAMLPLVAPAVIKLDLRVTQDGPNPRNAQVLDVVHEEAERTGAIILCEGIETDAHLKAARGMGAVLGQGHYFGRPGTLADYAAQATQTVHIRADTPPTVTAPFDALQGHMIGRGSVGLLASLCQHLESYGADAAGTALFITHFPTAELFRTDERSRLAQLIDRGVMTAVLGPGIPAEPGDGIRGVGLRHDQEFVGEWASVALNPSSAVAMLARAVDDTHSEFEYGLTHDKQRVIAAARCLFRRLGAVTPRFRPGIPVIDGTQIDDL